MKHIVFILGSYHPNISAVGNCAHQVIRCLEMDYHITVVAISGALTHTPVERFGQVDIVRVETKNRLQRMRLAQANGRWCRIVFKLHRLVAAARKLFSAETIEQDLVDAYLAALMSQERPIDVIVPLVFPFESVLAALAYKRRKSDAKVVPYLFDDFVESRSLHLTTINRLLKKRRHLTLERTMLDEADAELAMHPLRAHFEKHFPLTLLQNMQFLEHPLLTPIEASSRPKVCSNISISYTGGLFSKVREPDYLLELLRIASFASRIQVDFFVMGNDAHKVKSQDLGNNLHITNHGAVSKVRAAEAMVQSNVLLNLGEIRGKQVSSKVFEYMAAGKPIVHLAFVPNDVVSTILAKYPLALCLVQTPEQLHPNARMLAEFIELHKHSQLSFAQVAAIFPEALPATTANLMRQIFDKVPA